MLVTKAGTFLKAASSSSIFSGIRDAAITKMLIAKANVASMNVSSRVISIPRRRNPLSRGSASNCAGRAEAISSCRSIDIVLLVTASLRTSKFDFSVTAKLRGAVKRLTVAIALLTDTIHPLWSFEYWKRFSLSAFQFFRFFPSVATASPGSLRRLKFWVWFKERVHSTELQVPLLRTAIICFLGVSCSIAFRVATGFVHNALAEVRLDSYLILVRTFQPFSI